MKGAYWLLALAVVVFLLLLLLPEFFRAGKDEAFSWDRVDYDPNDTVYYTQVAKKEETEGSRRSLIITIRLPDDTSEDQSRNTLFHILRRELAKDSGFNSAMILAYRSADNVQDGYSHTMGKAVWGPGGRFIFPENLKDEPYHLHYFSPVAYRNILLTEERERKLRKESMKNTGRSSDGGECNTGSSRGGGGG